MRGFLRALVMTLVLGCAARAQVFQDIQAGLMGVYDTRGGDVMAGSARTASSFGDMDKDGDLDLLVSGFNDHDFSPLNACVKVYRNDQGRFTDLHAFDTFAGNFSAAWADVDGDSYLDVLIDTTLIGDDSAWTDFRLYAWDPGQNRFRGRPFPSILNGAMEKYVRPLLRFADFDKDGDPDLLISSLATFASSDGGFPFFYPVTKVFRNDGGAFTDLQAPLTQVWDGAAEFADMDGDGDLDLFLSGDAGDGFNDLLPVAEVYRFDQGNFKLFTTLPGIMHAAADWADYDGDGRLDLAVCGSLHLDINIPEYKPVTRLYKGTPTGFTAQQAGLDSVYQGSVSFADMDDDKDPDLLLTGEKSPGIRIAKVYRNDGGRFLDVAAELPVAVNTHAFWADYDKDGHPDIFLSGDTGTDGVISRIYRNLQGQFATVLNLPPLQGNARFADYDNDGDLDALLIGNGLQFPDLVRLFRNEGGTWQEVPAGLPVFDGDAEWGDFDGDGFLDLVMRHYASSDGQEIRLFRNRGNGTFAEMPPFPGLPGWRCEGAHWGDMDGDGDLDLVVWGDSGSAFTAFTRIFGNDGKGNFHDTQAGLPGQDGGTLSLGDCDRDGDLDLLFSGYSAVNIPVIALYRNQGGTFVRDPAVFPPLKGSQSAWGDFDNDGDLDFVLSGTDGLNFRTNKLFRNNAGLYEEFFQNLEPISANAMGNAFAWEDWDNDGDLDLFEAGSTFTADFTILYRNQGGVKFSGFLPLPVGLNGGIIATADIDGDGDVDLASGPSRNGGNAALLRNTLLKTNAKPSVPAGLRATLGSASVTLAWGPSADAETPSAGLHYNVRVGTSPGKENIVPAMADPATGFRRLSAMGNAGFITSKTLTGLAPGTYYWSVQALDKGTGASAFASEGSFTLGMSPPVLLSATAGRGAVTLRWNRLTDGNFLKYYIHYGLAAHPTARLDSVLSRDDTVKTLTGLRNESDYYFRVSAVDSGANASGFSGELAARPDGTAPAVPRGLVASPGDRSITLRWEANREEDFLAYVVYQRALSGPLERIDSIPDMQTTAKTVTGLRNGVAYAFYLVAVDRVLNHSGFSPETGAVPAFLLQAFPESVAFGKIPLGGTRDAPFRIHNAGDLPVSLDSVKFTDDAFSLAHAPAELPGSGDGELTFRFSPSQPYGGNFSGRSLVYFGGNPKPMEVSLSGFATAKPYCRIQQITPSETPWDTAATLTFLATANDSDNAGEGDRIRAYLWTSSLAGPLGQDANSFTLKPSELGIGAHVITLRVVDNEGDTSEAVSAPLAITGRKPLARIDSISPRNVILRGKDQVRIFCSGRDLDEGASEAHDSLRFFGIFSTLQGLLAETKGATLDSSRLSLGVHGFYALAVDDEGDTVVSDTQWVPVQAGLGAAVVVAGTALEDYRYFFQNIAPGANWAYAKLRQRGFTDELIEYMNPVGWQSIRDPYRSDTIVDETRMTAARLRERILGLKSKVANGVPLLLTLIGHGSDDRQSGKFLLSPDEAILPDSLDAWLNALDIPPGMNTPIILVLDFCYAGTFLPKLKSSRQNRIVITSAAADRQAYFRSGRSFSHTFFQQIQKGGSVAEAWAGAKVWSDANALSPLLRANPQVNANNDNIFNDPDLDLGPLQQVYIGGSQAMQGEEAQWKDVTASFDRPGRAIAVHAGTQSGAELDRAWFSIVPPDFDPLDPAWNSLPTGDLAFGGGSYAGRLTLPELLAGDYLILVHGLLHGEPIMPLAFNLTAATGVQRKDVRGAFGLSQNFPNPARELTVFRFTVTKRGKVRLDVHDLGGRKVKTLMEAVTLPGSYAFGWDGRDDRGMRLPAGIYGYSLVSGEGVVRKKLILDR